MIEPFNFVSGSFRRYPRIWICKLSNPCIAFGHGGLTGAGFGQGIQKLHYLPEAHNDFIFAIIGEEFGFIGSSLFILVFCSSFGGVSSSLFVVPICSACYPVLALWVCSPFKPLLISVVLQDTIPLTGVTLAVYISRGLLHDGISHQYGVILGISREQSHKEFPAAKMPKTQKKDPYRLDKRRLGLFAILHRFDSY